MLSTSLPLFTIGYATILLTRIGWSAFIGIPLIAIIVPVINCLSSYNGNIAKDINKFKEQRVQMTTDMIEGIKYIKLYGWELAFEKIIGESRHK